MSQLLASIDSSALDEAAHNSLSTPYMKYAGLLTEGYL